MTEDVDAKLLQEWHWCPSCQDAKATKPYKIRREQGCTFLIVSCPKHGDFTHEPMRLDCWCIK